MTSTTTQAIDPLLRDVPTSFETERLILRAPRAGDGAMVQPAIEESFEQLHRWMPWARTLQPLETTELVMRRGAAEFLARTNLPIVIVRKDDGTFVGGSGLHRIDWSVPKFEIGYWCRTSLQRRGYLTESTRGLAKMAFDVLGAKRVEIHCDPVNVASRGVALKAGFALEGIHRNDARSPDGSLRDTCVYALIDTERSKLDA
jgi:RimJ/RimL family protein N-acetyltransferase